MNAATVITILQELGAKAPAASSRQFFAQAAHCVAELQHRVTARDVDNLAEAETVLRSSAPTPGQMIERIFAWIATYRDGSEGIIAGGLEGIGMTTLLSSRRHVAEKLERVARESQRLTLDTRNPVVNVRLVEFASTEARS
jgi:hypothetical protein